MHKLEIFYEENKKIFEYALKHIRDIGYKNKEISKKNGGKRLLSIPPPVTKAVQKKLNGLLQEIYIAPKPVHAFITSSKKNIVSNASYHVNKNIVIGIDISNFFDSINFGRVRGLFIAKPFGINDKIATKLAQVMTINNMLPQGAPTSPIISNLICIKLDHNLINLAKKYSLIYTRYADDITFSTYQKYTDNEILNILLDVKHIINANGFFINTSKLRVQRKNHSQIVTGLKVNSKVNVTRKYVKQIRSMLYSWWNDGIEEASNKHFKNFNSQPQKYKQSKTKSFQNILNGKINFLGQVKSLDDSRYIKFLYTYILLSNEISKNKKLPFFEELDISQINSRVSQVVFQQIYDYILILTEGETDVVYLKSALSYFQEKDEFLNLKLRFLNLKGWVNVKKIHLVLSTEKINVEEFLIREKIKPFISDKLKYCCILDSDDDGIVGYFKKQKDEDYFLIDKKNKGYIEKLIDKNIILEIIDSNGYIIDPTKAEKKTKSKLEKHLKDNKSIDEIYSIDNYIVYKDKLIKKTLLAKDISEKNNINYEKFRDIFLNLEKIFIH